MMIAVLERDPVSQSTTTPARLNPLAVKNILVPVDFSRTSLEALHYAVPIAKRFHAKITLLHVLVELPYPLGLGFNAKNEYEVLESVENHLDRLAELTISRNLLKTRLVRVGNAAEAIALVAREEKHDLIILTTHGWTGFKHFTMGSTAERVIRLAPCPVLAVRKPEHESAKTVRHELLDLAYLSSDIS